MHVCVGGGVGWGGGWRGGGQLFRSNAVTTKCIQQSILLLPAVNYEMYSVKYFITASCKLREITELVACLTRDITHPESPTRITFAGMRVHYTEDGYKIYQGHVVCVRVITPLLVYIFPPTTIQVSLFDDYSVNK